MSTDSRMMLLQKGVTASIRSTVALIVLSIVEAGVSVLSGSVALLADAVHTLTDLVGSAIVWIGLRLSMKKPTDQFPYGFYKAESISALIVSIIIVFAGVEILGNSVDKFYSPSTISFRPLVIGVAIGSGPV